MGGISKIIPIQTWGMFRIGEKQKKKKKGKEKHQDCTQKTLSLMVLLFFHATSVPNQLG